MIDEIVDSVDEHRFRAEISVSAQLQHPNIVSLCDSGEIDGRPYYVMPFIEGESLRARISRVEQFSVPDPFHCGSSKTSRAPSTSPTAVALRRAARDSAFHSACFLISERRASRSSSKS
jgi:serine/threonine protein kinase